MKILLDENLPLSLVDDLTKLGHKVDHICTVGLRGADDETIAKYAKKQKAILVTKDIELGSLLLYPSGSHYAVVIVRLPPFYNKHKLTTTITTFFKTMKEREIINAITILQVGRYRIRKLGDGSEK